MDKKKAEMELRSALAFLEFTNDHTDICAEWRGKQNAKRKIRKVLKEIKEPTLDDYIQALPYLTFDEDKYGEGALKVTDNDWAYAPTLYKFEGKWLIDWVEGEDNDSGKVIEGSTPLEAAKNAYNYCVDRGFIKDTLNHG